MFSGKNEDISLHAELQLYMVFFILFPFFFYSYNQNKLKGNVLNKWKIVIILHFTIVSYKSVENEGLKFNRLSGYNHKLYKKNLRFII
jgi:hypothetical protein